MGGVSSEAAQKAYPDDVEASYLEQAYARRERAAFDRGAVEALRQAAMNAEVYGDFSAEEWLRQMRKDWEVGQ